MPELPEVETVMRGLQLRLEGRIVKRAVARLEKGRKAEAEIVPGAAAAATAAS